MRKQGINVKLLRWTGLPVRARRKQQGRPDGERLESVRNRRFGASVASNPATNLFINAGCGQGLDWLALRRKDRSSTRSFRQSSRQTARKKIAEDLNRRAYEYGILRPRGQYSIPAI